MILELLHPCDHSFLEGSFPTLTATVTRGESSFDVVDPINAVAQVVSVQQSGTLVPYGWGTDYVSYLRNMLEWIGTAPAPGSTYVVTYVAYVLSHQGYAASDCPRCDGQGWYYGLVNNQDQVTLTQGPRRVAAEFIGLLLRPTDLWDPAYTCGLVAQLSDQASTNVPAFVSAQVAQAAQLYIQQQGLDSSRTPAELLAQVSVGAVDVGDNGTVTAQLVLWTQSGQQATIVTDLQGG